MRIDKKTKLVNTHDINVTRLSD